MSRRRRSLYAPTDAKSIRLDNFQKKTRADLPLLAWRRRCRLETPTRLARCAIQAKLKLYSEAGEIEGGFRVRLSQRCKEQRDLQVEKLRKRYSSKLATLRDRIRAAEQSVARETEQYRKASFNSVLKIGSSLMGALFGRKLMSRTNISKASTSMRSLGSAAEQRGDIGRAKEKLEVYQKQLEAMEREFESDVAELELKYDVESLEFEPRKSDIQVQAISVVWTPWQVDSTGIAEPLFE